MHHLHAIMSIHSPGHSRTPLCNSWLCGWSRYCHVRSALLDTPEHSPARVKRRWDPLDVTDHTTREHKGADGPDEAEIAGWDGEAAFLVADTTGLTVIIISRFSVWTFVLGTRNNKDAILLICVYMYFLRLCYFGSKTLPPHHSS